MRALIWIALFFGLRLVAGLEQAPLFGDALLEEIDSSRPTDLGSQEYESYSVSSSSSEESGGPESTYSPSVSEDLMQIARLHFGDDFSNLLEKLEYVEAVVAGVIRHLTATDKHHSREFVEEVVARKVFGDSTWSIYSRYDIWLWERDMQDYGLLGFVERELQRQQASGEEDL